MIIAMKCRWSYMISVDQWVISWTLVDDDDYNDNDGDDDDGKYLSEDLQNP